jgi:hypothetical protein
MLFALGFVFMFTIGGLLNNHLALPRLRRPARAREPQALLQRPCRVFALLCAGLLLIFFEKKNLFFSRSAEKLEKTTICWEVLTIMILEFYLILVTKHNFEQLAGNLRIIPNNINIQTMALGYKTWGSSETKRSPHNNLL